MGVNYDFFNPASRIWNLVIFGRPGRSLCGYSDYLENTRSYFLWCFVVIPNLKDTVFGGVYGMDKTSDLGFAVIAPLKDIIGYGPWGRATNK